MPHEKTYDAVVVGGGPAGASAGYLLRSMGYRVLIIDRQTFPREKLCGGCLSDRTIRFLKRTYGETERSLLDKKILNFRAEEYQIFLNNREVSHGKLSPPFYFVERKIYDRYLLDRAGEIGVDILEGEEVVEIDPAQRFVRTGSGEKIYANYIVGADGVHSVVRKQFPKSIYDKEKWTKNLAIALEAKVDARLMAERTGAGENCTKPMLFLGAAEWGYGWIFPNAERTVVGICSLDKQGHERITDSFRSFLKERGLDGLIDGASVSGYPLPYGNFQERPAYGNMLLIGDAGGFADPLLGEGIYYAHRTAELAAHAIDAGLAHGEDAAAIYQALLHAHVIPGMKRAKILRTAIYACLDLGLDRPVASFVSVFDRRLIEHTQGRRAAHG